MEVVVVLHKDKHVADVVALLLVPKASDRFPKHLNTAAECTNLEIEATPNDVANPRMLLSVKSKWHLTQN